MSEFKHNFFCVKTPAIGESIVNASILKPGSLNAWIMSIASALSILFGGNGPLIQTFLFQYAE